MDYDEFAEPYFWLGADADEVAMRIREQHQLAIEAIMLAPEGFDLTDPVADE